MKADRVAFVAMEILASGASEFKLYCELKAISPELSQRLDEIGVKLVPVADSPLFEVVEA